MGKEDKFGRFTIGRSGEKSSEPGEDKLVELYRNRAELKKEFQNLRDQCENLRDDVEERNEIIESLKSELTAFESLMSDTDSAFNVMTFYQLRGLWRDCQSRLKNLVVEMAQKRKTRERQRIAEEFGEKQRKRLDITMEREQRLRAQLAEQEAQIGALKGEHISRSGFWNFFKRRDLARQIDEAQRRCDVIELKIAEFVQKRGEIEADRPDDYEGIGTGGRRAINMVCLAMSQFLYDHYASRGLYGPIYYAMTGKPQEAAYGVRKECELLMQKARRAQRDIDSMDGFTDTIRQRTETIRSQANYRTEDDTIPLASSLANLPTGAGGLESTGDLPQQINLIADDVWDISEIFLE